MNFFRLRFLNTLLLFLIGIILGFVIKERFYPSPKPVYGTAYQPAGAAAPAPQTASREESSDEMSSYDDGARDDEASSDEAEPRARPAKKAPPADEDADNGAAPIVIEAQDNANGDSPRKPADKVLRDSDARFFRTPSDFAGSELEMKLQMITAKRSQNGWRLNFVYSGPGKDIEYLYVDDDEVLGDKPDLRIGYVYKVRFRCLKGDAASGNRLVSVTATGDKAPWATGLSAVE